MEDIYKIAVHRKSVAENIEKSFENDIEKAHRRTVGDMLNLNSKAYVWTEYAPGKFDWRVVKKKSKMDRKTAAKVPRGIKLQTDSWVEIYDKNGKKVVEDYFEDLGYSLNEKWNEKDGNYDIRGGGKMVVPKDGAKGRKNEENENIDDKFGVEKNTSNSNKQFKYFMPYTDNEDDLVKVIGASVKITEFDDIKDNKGKKVGKVVGDTIFFNKIK